MAYSNTLFSVFPKEEHLFDIIHQTSKTVWKRELYKKDIEDWLGNFKGEVFDTNSERIIALWLLSHFTFYNEDEVKHLCKVVYRDLIHCIIKDIDTSATTIDASINDFFQKATIISSEQTSGSGGFIAYFFRQINDLPLRGLFNFSITNISSTTENIIVIDDVTLTAGSEGQMNEFWKKARKDHPDKKFYLLTLLASDASCAYLKSEYDIEVICSITLDDRDKCFLAQSDVFCCFDDTKIVAACKDFAKHYGAKTFKDSLGYKDGQYTFGFYYNTPDNTLPIFLSKPNLHRKGPVS